jgi:dihydrofolate synthase/folylpolyglutamate synthase
MPKPFENYAQAASYLDAIPMFQIVGDEAADFDLGHFEAALQEMGNPHQQLSAIHVAGTNGKGSTCRLLDHVLRTDGQKTGLFSSPHLIDYRERVQIDGAWIPEGAITHFLNEYKSVIEVHGLTYFEISTALAFWWFADQNVDWAVIETGLGGRLDATNVIDPAVSVITSVGLDHVGILGDTIPEIAHEKAGIIKPKKPVITGPLDPEAQYVVTEVADSKESAVTRVETPMITAIATGSNRKGDTHEALIGNEKWPFDIRQVPQIQLTNWAVVQAVIQNIAGKLVHEANELLRSVWKDLDPKTLFRACMEWLHPTYSWYFDGGHNQQAIETLLQTVEHLTAEEGGEKQAPVFVLAAMQDKVTEKSFGQFAPYPKLYYYALSQSRAANLAALKTLLPQIQPFPTHVEAQKNWLREMQDQLVIFVGSFYFYKTVRDLITSFAST